MILSGPIKRFPGCSPAENGSLASCCWVSQVECSDRPLVVIGQSASPAWPPRDIYKLFPKGSDLTCLVQLFDTPEISIITLTKTEKESMIWRLEKGKERSMR